MRQPTESTSESTCREVGMSRISSGFLDRAFDNSDRRQYGMGVVGRIFGWEIYHYYCCHCLCYFVLQLHSFGHQVEDHTTYVLICRRSLKRSVARQPKVREQLEDIEDHRPYFTYWVTTVQILILFISIACYGFGTIGFNLNQRSGLVSIVHLKGFWLIYCC